MECVTKKVQMKRAEIPKDIEKQIYRDNSDSIISQFRDSLSESRTRFITRSIFITIYSEEEFIDHITKNPHPHTTVKDDREVLNFLVKEARSSYGDDYDTLYEELRKNRAQ